MDLRQAAQPAPRSAGERTQPKEVAGDFPNGQGKWNGEIFWNSETLVFFWNALIFRPTGTAFMIGSEKMGWLSTSNNQFCESWLPVALSGMIHDQNGPSLYLIGIIGSVNGMNCFRFISYLKPPQQLLVHVPLSNNIQIHIYICFMPVQAFEYHC